MSIKFIEKLEYTTRESIPQEIKAFTFDRLLYVSFKKNEVKNETVALGWAGIYTNMVTQSTEPSKPYFNTNSFENVWAWVFSAYSGYRLIDRTPEKSEPTYDVITETEALNILANNVN